MINTAETKLLLVGDRYVDLVKRIAYPAQQRSMHCRR
jgi:hypothetical protein